MSIGKRAGKGFLSLLYRGMLEKIMGLVAMVILARHLSPYDFGLVSITEVLLVLISVIGTTGLSEFLLAYRKDDSEEIFKAAFWFNLLVSLGVFLLFILILPFWTQYQEDNRILPIGIITGLIFLSSQLQALPKAWLNKNMMFDVLVKKQSAFIILIPIAKIVCVYIGLGVYSLIIPTLIFQPVLTLILYKTTGIYPGKKLHTERWKEIYHFTKPLIGSTILTRIADQGDKFILGKFLGLDKLGIYNIATQMAELITNQVVMLSNNILSSVLPKYVDDKNVFYKHYITFNKTFAFIVFPVLSLMILLAKPLILFLYGAKWESVVLTMQILLVYSALRAVTSSYGSVMNSFHLNNKSFIVILIYTPVHLLGSIIGSFYGVVGIATTVLVVKTLFINWNIKQMMDAVSKPFVAWYKDMAPYFINSAIVTMSAFLLLAVFPFVNGFHLFEYAIVVSAFFIMLYYMLFKLFFSTELEKISGFIGLTFPAMQKYFNLVFRV